MSWISFFESIKKYDFTFFGISFIIFILGILNLYSITHTSEYMADIYKTQIMWYCLSLVVGIGVSFVPPKSLFQYAWVFYFISVGLLVLVLLLGHEGMGAKRWIVLGPFRLQPSEITKIALVLALARWFSKGGADKELDTKKFIFPAVIALIPVVLIAVEPDLGTGLLLFLMFLIIAFYRRLKWKTIGGLIILGLVGGFFMYNFGLKQYQRDRIMTFFNPGQDSRGSGYNAIQSKIAIGSGQAMGKGFMKSSQASLQYLPENHTDFVFSIFSEEHGFLGSLFVIALYTILLFRFLWLADSVPRIFDSVVVVGLMSIFFLHIFVNMSMVMGMMPIVGLPLPYMSYGGSSLLSFGTCCGIATSISNSRSLF